MKPFDTYPDHCDGSTSIPESQINNGEASFTKTQRIISQVCDEIKDILLTKNRKYGDSAIHPKRVFSKASPIEQINVRLDDKLSRLESRQGDEDEDVEFDLIGYLVLKRVFNRLAEETI